MSDPIAIMAEYARKIQALNNGRVPNLMPIEPGRYETLLTRLYEAAQSDVLRLRKVLGKKHVAGQQWKRRRQRGKFGRVLVKQMEARKALPIAERRLQVRWDALQQWRARKETP